MVTGWAVALAALVSAGGPVQDDLGALARAAGRAWAAHDAAALIGRGPSLYLQMPGADPSLPVGRRQAAALLDRYLTGATELGWEVRAVRAVEPGRGYVEAVRRYVLAGTEDERRESVLLSYRRDAQAWVLVELRVVR